MSIIRIGVVGSGLMGSGIGQVAAMAGLPTTLVDQSAAALDRAREAIERSLDRFLKRGIFGAGERDEILGRISLSTALEDVGHSDLAIEAVTEDLPVKRRVIAALDALLPPLGIIASNTSSFSITTLAMGTSRPGRVLGLHFFNPVPVMALVEVVRTVLVEPEVLQSGVDFVHRLGKEPAVVRDGGGFVVNRLLIPFMMDAVRALESGVASIPDLDRAMQLGAGHPMGPLALLDLVGLDTAARAGEELYHEFREARFAPPPLLNRMIAAGRLGRKAGKGFYVYGEGDPVPVEFDR